MDRLSSNLSLSYEIVFVNDSSRDRSAGMLAAQYDLRPDVTRVVLFQNNFGQHMAIMAGFEYARGESIITLDANLQNPPEEIALLAAELIKGHDYVGTIRANRQDSWFRKTASRTMNHLRQRITRITMTDQGCMLLALGSGTLFALLLVRRFVLGSEVEGVFTLFALTFFLIGVMLFGLGLLGEYIGRIYQQVRERPRYVVQAVLEQH
jgi:glycosyltransferase involved in cell wall biosynthesis